MITPGDLSIGEVAAIVGVPPHALRAWERRYGVVRPMRSPRNQRRYTVEDVELLLRIKDAIDGGSGPMAPFVAAQGSGEDDEADGSVWRSALDLVPVVVLLLDERGRVIDSNDAAASATGLMRHELHGRELRDLVVPDDRARAAAVCQVPLAQRRGYPLTIMSAVAPLTIRFDCRPLPPTGGRGLVVVVGR